MATAAMILFNVQINVHAEFLEVSGEKKEVKNATYEALHTLKGGQIIGNHLTITGNEAHRGSYVVTAEGNNSVIELKNNTTIKKTNSDILLGLEAKDSATLKMIGGTITAFETGANFLNSNSKENKLQDITISSGENQLPILFGVIADKNSQVTLENVKVIHAQKGIFADNQSQITISGGSFDSEEKTIYASNGSTITLTNNVQITSSYNDKLHPMNYGLLANGAQSTITMTGGSITGTAALTTIKGGHINLTNVDFKNNTNEIMISAAEPDSIIELHGDTTDNTKMWLTAIKGGKIFSENLNITALRDNDLEEDVAIEYPCIEASNANSKIILTGKTTIKNVTHGLHVEKGGKISSEDLEIISNKTINSQSTKIIIGGTADNPNSEIQLKGKTTFQNVDIGFLAYEDGTIKMVKNIIDANPKVPASKSDIPQNIKKNKIEAKKVVSAVINGGHIDLLDTSATAESAGLQFLALSNSDPDYLNDPQKHQSSEINLTNTNLSVKNGIGILIGGFTNTNIEDIPGLSIGTVNLKNSEIHANVLLGNGIFENPKSWGTDNYWNGKEVKAISNGTFTLSADQSTLEGRANIAKDRNVHFDLKNNTTWTLKISKNEKDDDGNLLDIAQKSRSDVSTLNLDNSSIVFEKPTEDHYQTLHIGSGKPDTQEVYNATGDAKIYFNAQWSDGATIADQKTDRLLINGDVSGNTSVYVTGRVEKNNVQANTSAAPNVRGLSLIQVSGKATEDSFKLVNGYTTRDGLPDMYTLRAYGPDSSQGKADIAQNLFDEKNENFWDFRLQPELLGSNSGSNPDPESNGHALVPKLVPQTASYIVMPNALFHTGLTDIAKQDEFLASMRISTVGKEEGIKNAFFLYTYGNTATLSSKRGPLEYGYGADIRYAALQAGVALATLEGQNTTTHLGLGGTYGRLSFTPKDMEDADKSTLDKWALTAYGSIQHNSGFYIDALLSYGILKGHIANAIRGNTAKLNNAKMLSISTTIGKQFATGMEGLTFEPQAQLVYQHLMFNTIEDADNLTIDMKNPSQWLARIGGRLTKTISTENNRPMSFYGKVNLLKTFGNDGTIQIGRDFDLGPTGTSLEGGIGINAQLSQNLFLHGDVSYQQKLQKTGISGASFSGGIRYQF